MKKIMIVDDEEIFQYLAKSMLENAYKVVCVPSGEDALSIFDDEKPDLVLADLLMPGMSGLELQEALKDKYEGSIPIVFMTSDDREETEINSLRGGAMDFIRKPFQKEVLLRRIGNILTNISKLENLEEEARTDLLTGLFNKSYSENLLTERCKTGKGALMLFDLDGFKLVNDISGHDVGDKILIKFAEVLKSVIRSKDIGGRIGGDEFIAFCNNVTSQMIVETKAAQIQDAFQKEAKLILGEDSTIPIGVSIGVVYVPNEGTDYGELFKKADKALYNVKQNGKHDFAIYSSGSKEEKPISEASINKTRSVLDERNEPNGAFELGAEGFRDVYRFLKRTVKNYHTIVQYGIFTLELANEAEPTNDSNVFGNGVFGGYQGLEDKKESKPISKDLEEKMDIFGVTLCHSLRCSDVYTRTGTNQYWVLMPETSSEDCIAVVVQRILDNWKETGKSDGIKVRYEIEDI